MTQTAWLLVLGMLLAVNPPRQPLRLLGPVIAGPILALCGALGPDLLELLDVSVPTARVATGILVGIGAVVSLIDPSPDDDGTSPLLLRPDLALLAVTGGADTGRLWAIVAVGVAMASLVVPFRSTTLARLAAGAVVLLSVDLVVDGILGL